MVELIVILNPSAVGCVKNSFEEIRLFKTFASQESNHSIDFSRTYSHLKNKSNYLLLQKNYNKQTINNKSIMRHKNLVYHF